MNKHFIRGAVMAAAIPTLAIAQSGQMGMGPHRERSWEFGLSGGAQWIDNNLLDFLRSGQVEQRFTDAWNPKRLVPVAEARLGYNINRHIGISAGAAIAEGHGVRYLTPSGALTYTVNLNAKTSPFLLIATELTRINGENDRKTHSTWGAAAGVGLRHFFTERAALRMEGRMHFAGYKEVPMAKDKTFEPQALIGLTILVGGGAPEPQMVMSAARLDTIYRMRTDTIRTTRRDTVFVDRAVTNNLDADQVILRVQFVTDRSDILPISRIVLDTVAAAIIATPNSRWTVEGHTDSIGTDADNQVLSQSRAQAVVDYLVSKGVNRSIMTAVGYGEARPVFSNTTTEGRAQNRRVQLRRTPPPPAVPNR